MNPTHLICNKEKKLKESNDENKSKDDQKSFNDSLNEFEKEFLRRKPEYEKFFKQLYKFSNEKNNQDKPKPSTPKTIYAILILTMMLYLFSNFYAIEIGFNTFAELVKQGNVKKIYILNKYSLLIVSKHGLMFKLHTLSLKDFKRDLDQLCQENNIDPASILISVSEFKFNPGDIGKNLFNYIIFLAFFYWMIKRANRLFTGGKSSGKDSLSEKFNPFSEMFSMTSKRYTPITGSNLTVKFTDVKGCDEAKGEIMEFVEFLKNPDKFNKMGAKIPKGAILYGPPGTGKTLLAKAVAGEANVPFFSVAGSEFIEMIVGVGAKRIRELFVQAKELAPCIIFIDEIDAIGSSRSRIRSHSENDQTLNQLLIELDGFNTESNIVVLCGTNRFDQLDAALIRPGRLDRKIYLSSPDMKGRCDIFSLYLSKICIDQSKKEDFSSRLAGLTPGSTGADIASIVNEGAILATKENSNQVNIEHLESALDRLVLGNRLSKKLSDQEKRIVSIHECGHAVVAWYLKNTFPLLKISIIPRGNALGVNQFLPQEDHLYSKDQWLDMMAAILGGRAAEELIVGSISSGASDDLQKVTKMAYQKVGVFGMDESFGLMSLPSLGKKFSSEYSSSAETEYGPDLANKIDVCVNTIIEEAYKRAKSVITEHTEQLHKLSNLLYEKEIISNEEIEHVLGSRPPGASTVAKVLYKSKQE